MSFILDALKKSENERQKQSGPALFEVKVASPARRFPVWAIVVGALLGVNLVVLIAVLLMRDRQDPAVQDVQARIAANARGAAANTGPGSGGSTTPEPTATLAPGAMPTASAGAYPAAPGSDPTSGLAGTAPAGGATLGSDGLPIATGTLQASPGTTDTPTRFNPPLVEEDPADFEDAPARPRGAPINPADYMPATAGPPPAQASGMPQPSGYPMTAGSGPAAPPGRGAGPSNVRTASAIPSRDDLMASGMGDLPPASLSLHVYDKNPAARFVFVNGTRAKEGDTLPNGLRVDEITAEGTVLSYRGSRFLVPIQ